MRPQVGKRAGLYKPPKEVPKTKARLFVESRKKHNLSMREEYLSHNKNPARCKPAGKLKNKKCQNYLFWMMLR